MAFTLNATTLQDDTLWADEWSHSAVKQSVSLSLGGRQIIEESEIIRGRPITLFSQWLTKAVVDALVAERDKADNTMVLTIADGRMFNVRFKQSDSALKITPVIDYPEYQAGDFFDVTIQLFEV